MNPLLKPADKQRLLADVEDLLRTMPPRDAFGSLENESWLGRVAAALTRWDLPSSVFVMTAIHDIQEGDISASALAPSRLIGLLHQAAADLRFDVGPMSAVVPHQRVFDYFDEVRRLIESARSDVFFVDAYLDAEFVSRFLPHVAPGAVIRLLTGPGRLPKLIPAVDLFVKQHAAQVLVRASADLHDRYVFIDRTTCHFSGASFKDGAKNAAALVHQVHDFQPVLDLHERMWSTANVER